MIDTPGLRHTIFRMCIYFYMSDPCPEIIRAKYQSKVKFNLKCKQSNGEKIVLNTTLYSKHY